MPIPRTFRGFVDDAAIFPPGSMPLERAVPAHVAHRGSPHADLVGPFVVAEGDLGRTAALAAGGGVLAVGVVVADPAAVGRVIDSVRSAEHLRLAALEVKLAAGRDPLAQVDAVAAGTAALGPAVTVFVEVPRPGHPAWGAVLGRIAGHGLRAKLRTGGTGADAFPDTAEVAAWIHDTVAAGVPFKCTAGLHRAVRHTDARTGFEHHGYLNLLLATVLARRGEGAAAVRAALGLRDEQTVVDRLHACAGPERDAARASFLSYGSCSIAEPYEDLGRLGQLTKDPEAGDAES